MGLAGSREFVVRLAWRLAVMFSWLAIHNRVHDGVMDQSNLVDPGLLLNYTYGEYSQIPLDAVLRLCFSTAQP